MPREQLLGLAADVDLLLVAGITAAGGGPLRRRGKTIRELGAKVPALVPVADAVERVTAADKPAPAFLDLLVMARQLRASLAATGVEGPLMPLPEAGSWKTSVPVRELQPVYEALTQVGSGRDERIKDAAERNLFGDLRLASVLLEALDDGYPAVADAAAELGLPALGDGVLADLRAALDLNGKSEDARRLRAICRIEPKAGASMCRQAIEAGSVTLKAEALRRLPEVAGADEAERVALGCLNAKSREIRLAAVQALGTAKGEAALAALVETLNDEERSLRDWAAESLGTLRHPQATARLLDELQRLLPRLAELRAREDGRRSKGRKKPGPPLGLVSERAPELRRAEGLVTALGNRKDGDRRAVARALAPLLTANSELPGKAAGALRTLGPAADEIVPALVDLVAGEDYAASGMAIDVLGAIPPARRVAGVPALVGIVEDPKRSGINRCKALALLAAHADGRPGEILRAARVALTDRDLLAGRGLGQALAAVGKMGPAAKPLLPEVLKAFCDAKERDFFGLREGQSALTLIDPAGKEAIPALAALLAHKKIVTRWLALLALSEFGPKARGAAPAVEQLIAKSKDVFLTDQAEATLGAIR